MHDQRLFGPLWVSGTGRWGMEEIYGYPIDEVEAMLYTNSGICPRGIVGMNSDGSHRPDSGRNQICPRQLCMGKSVDSIIL